MSQLRLHFQALRPASTAIHAEMDRAFEDDGLPLALVEIDEAAGVEEISLYVEEDDAAEAERRLERILRAHGSDAAIEREALGEVDWVARTLEGLRPVRAGRFVVHGSHDRAMRRPGEIGIEIEAGLAFGTGHHGTTAGCLEMIDAVVRRERPRNALDLGTGSAVLAIALAKLARIPVLATDIDPVAVEVAAANVRLNGEASRIVAGTAPGFRASIFAMARPFDLIVANILARPLMMLAPQMARHITPGGSLILSGILDRQRRAVIAAYVGQGFRHARTIHREGWSTLHLKR